MLNADLPIILLISIFYLIVATACRPETDLGLKNIVTITERPVKELDALQSREGTLIAATMERSATGVPEHIGVIYRSEDAGRSWEEVFRLDDTSRYTRQYADPRLVEDPENGKIYLVLMEVRLQKKRNGGSVYRRDYYLGDIAVYVSGDDGKSWRFQSSPHIDPVGAYGDLPFPAVDRQGCLWVFHSRLDIRRLIAPSEIVVHRSCDGGRSWEYTYTFPDTSIAQKRKNLGNLVVKDEQTIAGAFADQEHLYYFELEYRDSIRLSRIKRIPHLFPESDIPIAFLAFQPTVNALGIITYLPHQRKRPVFFAGSIDGGDHWRLQKITEHGAYPNVMIRPDGTVFVSLNQKNGKRFDLLYTRAHQAGSSFSGLRPLYQSPYQFTERGEYQALISGEKGRKYLIFCDWSDQSRAKMGEIVELY